MSKLFKKFIPFVLERKNDKDAIEDVVANSPKHDTSIALVCSKCGEPGGLCDCFVDDYYNAKTPQQMPKGKTKTKKEKR